MIISRLIDKNFSEYEEEEKLYSVLMDEDELRLYSEFLEEREYAKVPFKGFVKTAENAVKGGAKAAREKGRRAMAEGMLTKSGATPGTFSWDVTLGSPGRIRGYTNPAAMNNGTYAKDLGLNKLERLNLKITREGRYNGHHLSGRHGTTLGNAKEPRL